MGTLLSFPARMSAWAQIALARDGVRWLAYVALCAAYVQGGCVKLTDFDGAVAEMVHFGVAPPALFASLVIVLELGGSLMILSGCMRWLGALALAAFTLMATGLALRFWEMPMGPERMMAANAFFEHLGLAGGLLLIMWADLRDQRTSAA